MKYSFEQMHFVLRLRLITTGLTGVANMIKTR